MRLVDLQLIAYGPFTGVTLDLSRGDPGLHLIFGPNEAGKSAALRALHALLYGIPVRTSDDFVHDMGSLRLGARIRSSSGKEIAFVRRKGQRNTVLDPQGGAAFPDDALDAFLGGVDAATFSRIYGIGHAELILGGEELRRMKGLAGESLFAAGLGGVALSDVLGALREEASALQKAMRSQLKDHRAAVTLRDQAARPARDWEKLHGELGDVERERRKVMDHLEELRAEHGRVERLLRALELVQERRTLFAEIEARGDVKILPSSYSTAGRRDATNLLTGVRPKVDRLRRKLDGEGGLRAQMAAIAVPEELLRQAQVIDSLRSSLGAHQKAAKDLSKLQTQRAVVRTEALAILGELRPGAGWEQAETLRLAPDRKVRIQDLAAQERHARDQPGKLAACEAQATTSLQAHRAELEGLGYSQDAAPLVRLLRGIRKRGDLDELRVRAQEELRRATEEGERALERLGLWKGALTEIDRLPVPASETIDRFTAEFGSLDDEQRRLSDLEEELDGRADRTAREIHVLRKSGDVPSESALFDARGRRDVGWALVRASWVEGQNDPDAVQSFAGQAHLADAYEASVKDADDVSDRLRREADRVAELAGLLAAQEEIDGKRAAANKQHEDIARRGAALSSEWQRAWAPAGIPEPLGPAEMRAWLGRHDKLVRSVGDVRKHARELEALVWRIGSAHASLSQCLAALGEPVAAADEPLGALVERCEDVVTRIERAARRRGELGRDIGKLETELGQLAIERHAAEDALVKWRGDWLGTVSAIGCGAEATGPEANARIARIDDLFGKVKEVADLDRRIESMQSDARELARIVSGLVGSVAPDLDGRGIEEAVGELLGRLEKAREDERTLKTLKKEEAERAMELADAEQTVREAQHALEELSRLAGVARPEELEQTERLSDAASQMLRRKAEIEQSLGQLAGGQPVEAFVSGAEDADALAARRDALSDEVGAQDQERTRLDQRSGEIRKEMEAFDGGGAAAEADERAMGILAQIRQGAERYIRLRVAETFLQRQVERHRAATQDPILTRASQLFATLTCGAFDGLRTDHDDDDQPIVVGVRPGDERLLTVEKMSDGTRDQLYLSLRLAYLEKHLDSREPLPFVVDDILVNFDEDRARATLRVLGQLAKRAQVLLFTHHERNIELATAAVSADDLVVHRLSGCAPPA